MTPALLLLVTTTAWVAVTRKGTIRVAAELATVVLLGVVITVVLTAEGHGAAPGRVLTLLAGSTVLVRYALRRDRGALQAQPVPGIPVDPASTASSSMNLRSGGGKVEQFALVEECRRRGIEPVILQPGTTCSSSPGARSHRGADVIGMAGGDGSQALGRQRGDGCRRAPRLRPGWYRNRFALDLGLDRRRCRRRARRLRRSGRAAHRPGAVNERIFVNNVSLGVYAKIVRSPEYRDAKRRTTTAMLSDLLGPGAEPFDLHFVGPDGARRDRAGSSRSPTTPTG